MPQLPRLVALASCICLLSCAQIPSASTQEKSPNSSTNTAMESPPISEADFAACIARFTREAKKAGISEATLGASLAQAKLSQRVLQLDRQQPEFTTTFADYFNRRVTDQRIAQAQALWAAHRPLFNQVERDYGLPAQYLLAFWGLETNFGSYFGNIPVVDSLATLACDTRRSEFFSIELINALRILDEGDIAPQKMLGSWAGAMGNFQFMPSAYLKNAVDYDEDHKRDLWYSKADAIASAGNFLHNLGWTRAQRWGREVKLPRDFAFMEAGLNNQKTLSEWRKLGITRADNTPLPNSDMIASLLVPAGYKGPAFLVYHNFNVIMRWNRSEFYALSIGLLADQIAGGSKLVQAPPADAPRLSRQQVIQLQQSLLQQGFYQGKVDGIFGSGSRRALSQFQHQQGLISDGFPDSKVLQLLDVSSQ